MNRSQGLAGPSSPLGLQPLPPPRYEQQPVLQLSPEQLLDEMLEGGIDVAGLLGPDVEKAMLELRGGILLNFDQRKVTFSAAGNRMTTINKKLEELELKVANLFTSHHGGKIDMVHVQARVLFQAIFNATSTELIEVDDGQATRTPVAWEEVRSLLGVKTIKYAKDACAEILAASVAWRMCLIHREHLLAEFSSGKFSLDAFMRASRKIISVRLSFSQASGLTPRDARITLRNMGVFDWSGIVDEAIALSVNRLQRNRDRAQQLREVIVLARSNPALLQTTIPAGIKLTAEQVIAQLPDASDYVPLGPALEAMLAPEERAREPTRDDPTGAVRAGLLPPAGAARPAATTPARARGGGGGITAAAAPAPEAEVFPTPPLRAAAAAAATRIAATAAAMGATAAGVTRRSKRVASAGQRGGTTAAAAAAAPTRRQRVTGPSGSDGAAEGAEPEPAPPAAPASPLAAAAAAGSGGGSSIILVSAPAATTAVGVLALSADTLAAAANATEALALPTFVPNNTPGSIIQVIDCLTWVPPAMSRFALRLLRAYEAAEGSAGPTMAGRFCYEMAIAFDDASLLMNAIDQSGGNALAPNRVFIKSDMKLFGLGLGTCFTSFEVSEHSSVGGGGGGGDGGDGGDCGGSSAPRIFGDRVHGTAAFVVFVDPTYDGVQDPSTEPHAFELVYGNGLKTQLRHGTVLVSRPGGKAWRVESVAGANKNTNKNKKLREIHFFASREVARAVGSNAGGGEEEPAARFTVQNVIERLVATGDKSRDAAIAMFASA